MRRSAAVAAFAIFGLLAPGGVLAESALWTLVATPLTATTGVMTTFSLTATNEDPLEPLDSGREIGCFHVDLPANFAIDSVRVTGTNTGNTWAATPGGNRVTVRTTSGGNRLELLEWVRFSVTAMPLAPGQLAWQARAFRAQDCTGTGALLGVPPVVVVTGSLVTPTPAPTPTPTPTPTPALLPTPSLAPLPTATLAPLPSASLAPLPLPVLTPTPTPGPIDGGPATTAPPASSPTPDAVPGSGPGPSDPTAGSDAPTRTGGEGATSSPSASPSPGAGGAGATPTIGGGVPAGPSGGVPDGSRIRGDVGVLAEEQSVALALGPLGVAGTVSTWIVPGLLYGVPGLLLVAFALLQALGATAWIPAIRRLRGSTRPTGAA